MEYRSVFSNSFFFQGFTAIGMLISVPAICKYDGLVLSAEKGLLALILTWIVLTLCPAVGSSSVDVSNSSMMKFAYSSGNNKEDLD